MSVDTPVSEAAEWRSCAAKPAAETVNAVAFEVIRTASVSPLSPARAWMVATAAPDACPATPGVPEFGTAAATSPAQAPHSPARLSRPAGAAFSKPMTGEFTGAVPTKVSPWGSQRTSWSTAVVSASSRSAATFRSMSARPMRIFDGVERFALTLWPLPPGLDYDAAVKAGQDALEFIQAGGTAEAMPVRGFRTT